MADKLAKTLAGIFGFGLCKMALGAAYLTAMGSVFSSVGFISELSFMVPMLAASLGAAFLIALSARRRRLASGSLRQYPAVFALSLGFLIGGMNLLSCFPDGIAALLCGLLCGFSSTVLNAVWLDVFSAERDATAPTIQIVGGLVIQCLLIPLAAGTDRFWSWGAPIAAACLSALMLVYKRRGIDFPARSVRIPSDLTKRRDLVLAYLCVFVLVGVVGILHTAVLGSRSEHLVGDVNMWVPLAVATLVTLLMALIALRRPHPTSVYRVCLPLLLVVLSLMPFFGDALGGLVGLVVIVCYDVCGMVFLLYIVDCSRCLDFSAYLLAGTYLGGSALFLLTGLGIGGILRVLSVDHGLSLLTLLAFAAIYPLAGVFMFGLRKVWHRPTADRGDGASGAFGTDRADGAVPWGEAPEAEGAGDSESFARGSAEEAENCLRAIDDVLEGGVGAIADENGLTRREREILGYLARGRSARYIAEDLVISENTVWAHVKRIYSKTGVHTKQELMSAVEKAAAGKR